MVERVDGKNRFCQTRVEMFKLSTTHVRFARIAGSNQRYKNVVFCRNYFFHNFGEGKIYPAALHKIPTQTVDSSQVLAKCIRQKQPQIIKTITKNWDKNTIKT